MTRSLRALCAGVVLCLALAGPAAASWRPSGTGDGYGKAGVTPQAATPTLVRTGRSVAVSWTATQIAPGLGASGYTVTRYNATTGVSAGITGGCSGTISVLACTEGAVPAGNWKYSVQARLGNWAGPESTHSTAVTVAAPQLSLATSTLSSLPSVVSGTLSQFVAGQTVTYRLDNATTGAVLSATTSPSTIPANGSASVSLTLPIGITNGSHTIYAIGSAGDVVSAAVNINVPALTPTSLTTTNTGGNTGLGRIATGETFEVGFSQTVAVASLCSTWSGNATNQSIVTDNVVTVIINNGAGTANDTMTVTTTSAACAGQFNLGTIDLGSPSWVTGQVTFSGAGAGSRSQVSWTAGTRRLLVTLGARSSVAAPARVSNSVTATYTPHPSITSAAGAPVGGTFSLVGVLF